MNKDKELLAEMLELRRLMLVVADKLLVHKHPKMPTHGQELAGAARILKTWEIGIETGSEEQPEPTIVEDAANDLSDARMMVLIAGGRLAGCTGASEVEARERLAGVTEEIEAVCGRLNDGD